MNINWDEIKLGIKGEIPENSYQLWIKPLKVLAQEDGRIVLGCPNPFARDWILKNYMNYIRQKFQEMGFGGSNIELEVIPNPTPSLRENRLHQEERRQMLPNAIPYDPQYTFENFVVGATNQFAYSASKTIAELSNMDYRILLMISNPGLGKTHLTKAILNRVHQLRPDLRVCYVTAEEFTTNLIKSIKLNKVEEFKESFRKGCDILLMEELHFLGGKQKTQVELGYTMDRLIDEKKTIVITSCLSPKEIPSLSKEFGSRLSLSLMTSIDSPDFDTRYRIAELKAQQLGLKLNKDIITKIAFNIRNDIRNIECVLKYIKTKSNLLNSKITTDLVDEVINNLANETKAITSQKAEEIVCKYFKITPDDLSSKSKKKELVYVRNIFAYLCRKHCNLSLKDISKKINRAHSTILHGLETLERDMSTDEKVRQQVRLLEEKLGAN